MTDHVVTPEAFAGHDFVAKHPLDELTSSTDLSACLMPLLQAMQWRGTNRQIAEALPHFTEELDITGFLNVMANLRFGCRQVRTRLDRMDSRLMPCLFVPRRGPAMVLLRQSDLDIRAFDPELGMETNLEIGDWEGTAYLFSRLEEQTIDRRPGKASWFTTIVTRFRRLVYQMLGLTLVLNLFALATPLFVMAVYDRVVTTGSLTTLTYFGIGVVIALACDLLLRFVRASALMFVGARLDNILGNAVFQRILFLPPAMLEHATIGAQVSRIKDFETVRDFFTGPMALVFLELPFVVVFIVVIAFLGGPIAFVPLAMLALMALLGFIVAPLVRAAVTEATRSGSKRQEFVVETLATVRTLKFCAAEGAWLDRFRDLSARAAMGSFRIAQYTSLINTLSHVLMIAAGTATIAFGVFRVFEGEMTVGALVASMILVWRVLAPLQTGLVTLGRLTQVRSSIGQINNLMTMKPEGSADRVSISDRRVEGRVAFSRVSMRYSAAADPALVGLSFTAEPGEVVSVIGGNGSGKSTMIKLMLGIYTPQAGSIRVGRRDVRQFDPIELRRTIAYVPQEAEFFYGTIAQNLRLADPVASDEDLRWAVNQAGILDDVLALEEGSGKWRRTGFEVQSASRNSQRAVLESQIQQRQSGVALYKEQEATLKQVMDILKQELDLRRPLVEKGLATRTEFLEVQREVTQAYGDYVKLQGEWQLAAKDLAEARSRLAELETTLREEALSQMGAVTAELAQVREAVAKLDDRANRLEIRAPVRRIVKGLQAHTIGGVIAPGALVLEIVPMDKELIVEARVATTDVGHIEVGQPVTVKVLTYDYARYGGISGRLRSVSASTFVAEDETPYYKAVVELDRNYVGGNADRNLVLPGMTVQADIKTGRKTLLQYLLKPVYSSINEAFRER